MRYSFIASLAMVGCAVAAPAPQEGFGWGPWGGDVPTPTSGIPSSSASITPSSSASVTPTSSAGATPTGPPGGFPWPFPFPFPPFGGEEGGAPQPTGTSTTDVKKRQGGDHLDDFFGDLLDDWLNPSSSATPSSTVSVSATATPTESFSFPFRG